MCKLCFFELLKSVSMTFLNLTQTHVVDPVAHLTDVEQRRAQRLRDKQKVFEISTFSKSMHGINAW